MILTPDRKPGDAAYVTADDWLTSVDLPEGEVCIPIGAGLWVRYRGLGLAEEQAAFRAARTALIRLHQEQKLPPPGPDECDHTTLVCQTLARGILVPHLTPEQALALRHKNGQVLDQLYRLIRHASRITPEELDGIVDELVRQRTGGRGLAPDAGPGSADDAELGAADSGDA